MTLPMLADFAVRLAGGLAGLLLVTPWRVVPPAFYRTHCLVMLGMLVLAAAFIPDRLALGAVVTAAALAYAASIGWGLGLRAMGAPATVGILLLTGSVLVASSRSSVPASWALAAAARLSSAFLLGSAMSAMLLGHHYLTAPAMSIEPLKGFVRCMAIGLVIRALLSLPASWALLADTGASGSGGFDRLLLAIRWSMGLLGGGLACGMAWETSRIRSTQSATGILYIGVTLTLFGELGSILLARDTGLAF
jgi:hypothetical protein